MPCGTEKKWGGKKIKLCPQAKYNVFWGFLNPIFIAELFQDYILPTRQSA